MKIPKTPIAFDYDLWTTEDGKCMVRIKRTGEVTEVDRKVMRMLRAEEKKIRRTFDTGTDRGDEDTPEVSPNVILSLDAIPEDDVNSPAWIADPNDYEEEVTTALMTQAFCARLSQRQLGVFQNCIVNGKSASAYAREIGVDYTTVLEARDAIRKKFKLFLSDTP